MEALLTPAEAAKILKVHRTSLWRFQSKGLLTYVRIGNAIRYRQADLEAFIEGGVRGQARHQPGKPKG